MPLCLELDQRLCERSGAVESLDLHPDKPWVLAAFADGTAVIWDWRRQAVLERVEVGDAPLRCARFLPEEEWIVAASDDMLIRVVDHTVPEVLREVEAHDDYIRFLAVHPGLPLVLSCSDDASVKVWDTGRDWQCRAVFQEHCHAVTMCRWEESGQGLLASSSMDMLVKVWRYEEEGDPDEAASPASVASLEGHEAGVTCLAFAPPASGSLLASGAEDLTVRIWDYAAQTCLRSLTGHSCGISAVAFHPLHPLLFTGSEDRTVQAWSSESWQAEETWHRQWDPVGCLAVPRPGAAQALPLAVGHGQGLFVAELRAEEAVAVVLHGLGEGPEGPEVHCAERGGDETAVRALRVVPGELLAGLCAQLAEAFEVPQRKLQLYLPGGRRLRDGDGAAALETLLGAEA